MENTSAKFACDHISIFPILDAGIVHWVCCCGRVTFPNKVSLETTTNSYESRGEAEASTNQAQ